MRKLIKSRIFLLIVLCLAATLVVLIVRSHFEKKFESARDEMLASFADRLGVTVEYESMTRRGFNTLVITGLAIDVRESAAETPMLACGRAEAVAGLWDVLRGEPSLRSIDVYEPELHLVVSPEGGVVLPRGLGNESKQGADTGAFSFFRSSTTFSVHDGTLSLADGKRGEKLTLNRVEGRFAADEKPRLRLRGNLAERPLARVSFATGDETDMFALHGTSLPTSLADTWLLDGAGLIHDGDIDADFTIRMPRAGDVSIRGAIDFHRVRIKDAPDYLPPLTGKADIDMARSRSDSTYTFRRVDVVTDAVAGVIEGSMQLEDGVPTGSLTAKVTKFPFDDLFGPELSAKIPGMESGRMFFGQETTFSFDLSLPLEHVLPAGSMNASKWRFAGTMADGAVGIEFGDTSASWDREGKHFAGTTTISNGQIEVADVGETVEISHATVDLVESARLQFGNVEMAALGGNINLFGTVRFTDKPDLDLSYEAKSVDAVRFGQVVRAEDVFAAGRCDLRGRVRGTPADIHVAGDLNLDDAELVWDRWFEKKSGLAGAMSAGYYRENGRARLEIETATMDQTEISGTLLFDEAHETQSISLLIEADSPEKIGDVARLPIDITGRGSASFLVNLDRTRTESQLKLVGRARQIDAAPAGATYPVLNATDMVFTCYPGGTTKPTEYIVESSFADIPDSLDGMRTWIDAFKSPDSTGRHDFNLSLRAGEICWGRATAEDFNARFSSDQAGMRWHEISMTPYQGALAATWHLDRETNKYASDVKWKSVELGPFLEWVMGGESSVNGDFSGEVKVEGTAGSGETRTGTGYLDVTKGEVDPFYLASKFEIGDGDIADETVPIQFDRLHTSVNVDGDKINTPDIKIDKEGIEFDGQGWTHVDGDAEYVLNVVLSPQVVKEIPVLQDKKIIDLPDILERDLPLEFTVRRKGGEVAVETKVKRLDIGMIEETVDVGADAVGTGKKVLEYPAQLLFEVLKYLPGSKKKNGG